MREDLAFPLVFNKERLVARFVAPTGLAAEKVVEVRTDPITGRTCRITYARVDEKETGTASLPVPPPTAVDRAGCPFCRPQINRLTPQLPKGFADAGRLVCGNSVLFPNLFPYGSFSAVSLFDDRHFVEIGTADATSYADSFINCRQYLKRVLVMEPKAQYLAVTQNHLPSAGGSLVHPHLQVHADLVAPNHLRFLQARADAYSQNQGRLLMSEYLKREIASQERIIGSSGDWHWLAAFAPEGFYEIWAILPGATSLIGVPTARWTELSSGLMRVQRFFRSLNRNGYNLGLVAVETPESRLELRLRVVVRANHAPWTRNDHTGYEVILGDMATFTAPEETAAMARRFWE
ncbi:MAG: galactose-1-phosphate uridylyltransferase [Desulfobacterales bacterium]|nr:galactose-1-phosphate uridylyltransferase [Desulfobacterales bacterium]